MRGFLASLDALAGPSSRAVRRAANRQVGSDIFRCIELGEMLADDFEIGVTLDTFGPGIRSGDITVDVELLRTKLAKAASSSAM